jgi:hypothetical protein
VFPDLYIVVSETDVSEDGTVVSEPISDTMLQLVNVTLVNNAEDAAFCNVVEYMFFDMLNKERNPDDLYIEILGSVNVTPSIDILSHLSNVVLYGMGVFIRLSEVHLLILTFIATFPPNASMVLLVIRPTKSPPVHIDMLLYMMVDTVTLLLFGSNVLMVDDLI